MDKKQEPKKPAVQDLPVKPLDENSAKDVKGGVMGPGTQTEDDIYVGLRKR
jgi:hypothetical protein